MSLNLVGNAVLLNIIFDIITMHVMQFSLRSSQKPALQKQ